MDNHLKLKRPVNILKTLCLAKKSRLLFSVSADLRERWQPGVIKSWADPHQDTQTSLLMYSSGPDTLISSPLSRASPSQINTHQWNRDLQKAAPTCSPRAPPPPLLRLSGPPLPPNRACKDKSIAPVLVAGTTCLSGSLCLKTAVFCLLSGEIKWYNSATNWRALKDKTKKKTKKKTQNHQLGILRMSPDNTTPSE